MPREHRINIRSDAAEAKVWREAAERDHLTVTSWLRRLAWAAVERQRPRPFGPSKEGSPRCESGSPASGGNRPYCTCDTCF